MRNIKLTIQYDGSRYSGWQSQKNAKSVQDVIENAIRTITKKNSRLIGSGRTDAGVHAEAQVANFKTNSAISLKNLRMALNSALPEDIVVTGIEEVPLKFNAQHDARSKLYRYAIFNADFIDPLSRYFAAKCFYKLSLADMRKAAKLFIGKHDFKSFRTNDGLGEKDTVRTIKQIKIEKRGNLIYIYIEADGFLYNMIRAIVGTLIEIGRGKFAVDSVKDIFSKKDRRYSGPTVPAKGLCLLSVRY